MLIPWHSLTVQEVAERQESNQDRGLSPAEAARRLREVGPNRLLARKRPGLLLILGSQFKDPMVLTLLAATGVSAAMGEILDAAVIAAIVIMNAILGTVQEFKAESTLDALENYAPPNATVVRGGRQIEVPRESVVPGDLIHLTPGVRVPADARVVKQRALQVEEAALTGEALPRSKESAPVARHLGPAERKSMVFGGTLVRRGEGTALVVATGMQTEMGQIADMVTSIHSNPTPLELRLESLGKVILLTCTAICAALVTAGLLRGLPFDEMLLTGVSLAVAAVPEGLPAVVTLSFAFGVQRIARRGAIVRRLEAIETLGSITVICTDKTGTLTRNQLLVQSVSAPEEVFGVANHSSSAERRHADILRVAVLASDARHVPDERASTGEDPTEQAIVAAALEAGHDCSALDLRYPRISEKAFSPERRMMSVKVLTEEGALICAKGASGTIIPVCDTQMVRGKPVALAASDKEAWKAWVEALSAQGMRVLAVAQRQEGASSRSVMDHTESGLCLLGVLSMADPLREEAAAAVALCKGAGIKPVLITGDHLLTAESVAREAGILSMGERGITGEMLESLSPSALVDEIAGHRVFARVSPAHKLKIVRTLSGRGEVVAMTGDGVNDAPALKEAAVGVAMGLSGTDVAREASSVVLMDDNFSTIVASIREGRSIYDNIRKFIRYLFSCNLGEVITMVVATAFGLPMPLTAAELLWMNLVTDGLPALALSRDPPSPDVMNRPPRHPKESMFSRGLWRKILIRGLYVGGVTLLVFVWSLGTEGLEVASTMAYATLVTVQLVAAFDCQSEDGAASMAGIIRNPFLLVACVLSFAMLLGTVQWLPLATFFRTVPLSASQWAVVFLCSIFPDLMSPAFSRKKH